MQYGQTGQGECKVEYHNKGGDEGGKKGWSCGEMRSVYKRQLMPVYASITSMMGNAMTFRCAAQVMFPMDGRNTMNMASTRINENVRLNIQNARTEHKLELAFSRYIWHTIIDSSLNKKTCQKSLQEG